MASFPFPEGYWHGRRAAITLSYDDGFKSNLDYAIPMLEKAGFRGTFYLQTGKPDVQANVARWKEAFENGHDVSNHSVSHFCGRDLLRLTKDQLKDEVHGAERWLIAAIGYSGFRSYAFPCTEIRTGDPTTTGDIIPQAFHDAYLDVVQEIYMSSRTGFGAINDDFSKLSVSQHLVDGWSVDYPHGTDPKNFIDYCKAALNSGGWGILIFHGIGDDNHPTDVVVHQAVVDYLRENQDSYWVAPFGEIVKHIRQNPPK